MPKAEGVTVQLVGEDGNVFAIIGAVGKGLRKGGYKELADEFVEKATNAESYDEVLRLAMEYVDVT